MIVNGQLVINHMHDLMCLQTLIVQSTFIIELEKQTDQRIEPKISTLFFKPFGLKKMNALTSSQWYSLFCLI